MVNFNLQIKINELTLKRFNKLARPGSHFYATEKLCHFTVRMVGVGRISVSRMSD